MENKGSLSSIGFLKNMLGFSIATWVSFGLSFFSSPFTTRLFLPEEVGRINLFNTYMTMLLAVVCLGLDQSYVRYYNEPPEDMSKKTLLRICVGIPLSLLAVLSLGILIMGQEVATLIVASPDPLIPVCLVICVLANVILKFFNLTYQMKQDIVWFNIQGILIALVSKVLYVIVGIYRPDYKSAILFTTIGYLLLTIAFMFIQRRFLFFPEKKEKRARGKAVKVLLKFGIPLMPVTILTWLNASIAQLLLKMYVSFEAIGIYSNAVSFASLITILQTGFNAYWVSFAYKNYKDENKKICQIHSMITFAMVLFGLLLILFEDVLYLLIGANFRDSKSFFPFLLLAPICYTIAETTGLGINISQKSYLNIVTFAINTSINILLCFLLLPRIGTVGAAVASSFAAIAMLCVKTVLGERYYKCVTSYKKSAAPIIIILLAATYNYFFIQNILVKNVGILVLIGLLVSIYHREVRQAAGIIKNILNKRK